MTHKRRTIGRGIKAAAVAAGGLAALGSVGAPYASATGLAGPTSNGNGQWAQAAHGEVLGQSNVNTGDVVAFWQGFLASYGYVACPSGIDGHFGPATAAGTKQLQKFFSISQDGVVGSGTWGAAGSWLTWSPGTTFDTFQPIGASRVAVVYANVHSNGAWKWTSPVVSDGGWHGSDTPGISFTNDGSC
jgi:hypothetical protein